jgi:hypothetical protein
LLPQITTKVKIDEVLVKYLLKNRSLSLQGLGVFYINRDVVIPENADAEIILPADILSFEYDPRIQEDENLVSFYTQQTKKIKPLASADLDSFITLGKQFLNIGKPFIIEGLGTLEKTQAGITFKAGVFVSPRIEAPKTLTGGEKEVSSGLFGESHRNPPPNYDRRILTIIALVIVLGIAGLGVYYFFIKGSRQKTLVETTIKDTASNNVDTSAKQRADSTRAADSLKLTVDTVNFNIVVRDSLTDKRAENIQKRLVSYGHTTVISYTTDSISGVYKIGQPFFRPLKDTAWLKDSLSNIYHTHTYVERR